MGKAKDEIEEMNSGGNVKKREVITIVFLSILFLALVVLQSVGNTIPQLSDTLGSYKGVLSSLILLVDVSLVVVSVAGFWTAFWLQTIELGHLIFIYIIKNPPEVIPGISVAIVALAIILVIHLYLVKLAHKEGELFNLAHTDALTDLPNRRSLKQKMEELIESNKNDSKHFAIAMIDIDNFKNINDTIGHDWGDKVLSEIAERWKKLIREEDFICRLGGDDFALIINDYKSLEDLDTHLKKLSEAVAEKFVLKGKDYFVTASVGVTIFPNDSTDISQLLKYADMAMFVAKNKGRKRICYFDSMMNDAVENNVEIEHVIRRALETDMFRLVFQPQFEIGDKKLRGFETLIRLSDEEGKQVSPAEFVPIAEKSALIMDLDRWVLRHAMMDFVDMVKDHKELILSINVSANHILDDSFLDDVDSIIKETNFPVENLEIELTESVFVNSLEKAKIVMNSLKERGIKIALDDFGTGYSSLSYMKDLPFDLLKIDKSFVDSINDGPREESFVAAIISLGQVMQFEIISEGVESQDQLDILKKLGCNYVQGYLWGKPVPLDTAKDIILKN